MVDVPDVTFSIDSAYSSGSRLLAMRDTKLCRTRGRHKLNTMDVSHKVSRLTQILLSSSPLLSPNSLPYLCRVFLAHCASL